MLAIFVILLLSFAVAFFAVRVYRATHGPDGSAGSVVSLSRGQRNVRVQRQRGFVRTLDGVTRDRSHRGRGGKSTGRNQIRKPWGW